MFTDADRSGFSEAQRDAKRKLVQEKLRAALVDGRQDSAKVFSVNQKSRRITHCDYDLCESVSFIWADLASE